MIRRALLLTALLLAGCVSALRAQDIRDRYVVRQEEDGTIYHTLPVTLFEREESGDLTFDITYKTERDGRATLNFTFRMGEPTPLDSVCFRSGRTTISGPVKRFYVEPSKREWVHRYSLEAAVEPFYRFFDAEAEASVTLYSGGRAYRYEARRRAWHAYAPVGFRIFEMIRCNEAE